MSAQAAANYPDHAVRDEGEGDSPSVDSLQTGPQNPDTDTSKHASISCLWELEEDPAHCPYRTAAIVATGIALLTSVGSIITAGVMWQRAYEDKEVHTGRVLYASLYLFTLSESSLSFVAILANFSELFFQPRAVLIRRRWGMKFVGGCIMVLLLSLGAVYSFAVPIVLKDRQPKVSPVLCVLPGVRFLALAVFFAVILAASRR
ncbi:hypothetical protein ABL78_5593 [Leptomonas seymouri]|uniref:Uncharacterized protein n=1 Tax=Leptomonas seymouri TaxID=5684 RepID=A0A0N1HUY2_LEPSE|nr:hypothetical protein ABL78_5593 [Leptomonas seymouri]|eukprot:KPI85338.1 hypothetical protein ABL78_5593 [Leptomonas seymouri]